MFLAAPHGPYLCGGDKGLRLGLADLLPLGLGDLRFLELIDCRPLGLNDLRPLGLGDLRPLRLVDLRPLGLGERPLLMGGDILPRGLGDRRILGLPLGLIDRLGRGLMDLRWNLGGLGLWRRGLGDLGSHNHHNYCTNKRKSIHLQ